MDAKEFGCVDTVTRAKLLSLTGPRCSAAAVLEASGAQCVFLVQALLSIPSIGAFFAQAGVIGN